MRSQDRAFALVHCAVISDRVRHIPRKERSSPLELQNDQKFVRNDPYVLKSEIRQAEMASLCSLQWLQTAPFRLVASKLKLFE